jgi:hypothetical protein
MEKMKEKNKIKKQSLIKQYKKKINLIRKLQAQSINDIIQLEKKKKFDESKIRHINSIMNDDNNNDNNDDINRNVTKLRKKNKNLSKDNYSMIENRINKSNQDHYVTESGNENEELYPINKNFNKIITFSNGFYQNRNNKKLKNKIDDDNNNLNRDNNYIEYLYEITSSYNNSNNSKSLNTTSNAQQNIVKNNNEKKKQKINDDNNKLNLYNYYYNIKNDNIGQKSCINNNIKNLKQKIVGLEGLEDYLAQTKYQKKRIKNHYSDSRKYNNIKRNDNNIKLQKGVNPNIEIPTFIKERVNKYNHSINRKSNNTYRCSLAKIPYCLNSYFSSHYNFPSNIPIRNNWIYNSNKKNNSVSNRTQRKNNDLNYKYIFFNNE